jgi:hypothetical protein
MEEKIFWVCMGSEHILDSTVFGTTTALFLDTKFAFQIPLCKKRLPSHQNVGICMEYKI